MGRLQEITNIEGTDESRPVLAMPQPLPQNASIWRRISALRNDFLSLWDKDAFEKDFFVERFGGHPIFIANTPELAAHILLANATNYIRSPIFTRVLEPGLGKGLLTTEGETWRRQRRMVAPTFAAKNVTGFVPAMENHARRLLARWDREPPAVIDIAETMSTLTLDIICEAMFSVVDDPEIAVIGHAVAAYQDGIRPSYPDLLGLPDWIPRLERRRVRKIAVKSDGIIRKIIESRRREDSDRADLLSGLLAADSDGTTATTDEVRDQTMTIITAGHETTATALTWVWYLLALHPAAEARLHREIDTVLADRSLTADDLPRLTYARSVIEEAMRLYPPIHTIARQAMNADRLQNTDLPPGATVLVLPWLLHRRRKWWPSPEQFDPDRFAVENEKARPRFAYLPFGGGPRICIGAAFAMTEMVVLLSVIARRWRLRLADKSGVEPVGSITLRPRDKLAMCLDRR